MFVGFVHYIQHAFAGIAQRAVKSLTRIFTPTGIILFGKSVLISLKDFHCLYTLFANIRVVENGEHAHNFFNGVEIGFYKLFPAFVFEHIDKFDVCGKACGEFLLI